MSVIKANKHQVGSNATASKNIVLEANTDGDLVISKGVHDGTLTEVLKVKNSGGIDATSIVNTPSGTIAATTVQGAINEIVSDLAASGGAASVGFLPSGTGAVATTVQGKLQEFVSRADYNSDAKYNTARNSLTGRADHRMLSDGGTTERLLSSKTGEFLSVKDIGAVGNYNTSTGTGTDDTTALQAAATLADSGNLPYVFFPTNSENYLVTSPIAFVQPGVKVFGTKGPSYNRGNGKSGNIVVGGSASYGIDFGNSSTSTVNPADSWAISNIGFLQANGVTAKTKSGVAFTRQNNGPDRGAIVKEISATGMYAGVYVKPLDAGKTISLATLVVENCDLSNNRYGIYSAGRVHGLRFVGNQAEQNNNGNPNNALGGAVHGQFMGPITINDNMLEGQPDAVNIISDAASIKLESRGNYFETNNTNTSSFVYQLGSISGTKNSANIGPNFVSGVNMPTDYFRLTGGGDWEVQMNDAYPVVFNNLAGSVLNGSKIFGRSINYYRVRQLNMAVKVPEIYVDDGLSMYDTDSAWTHVKYTSGTQMDTPLGVRYVQDAGTLTSIPMAVTAGDLVVINLMVLCKDVSATTFAGQIYTHTGTYNFGLGASRFQECSLGKWVLVSIPMRMQSTIPSFQFKIGAGGGTYTCLLAGISAKNFGAFANDGTTYVDVSPVAPKFN